MRTVITFQTRIHLWFSVHVVFLHKLSEETLCRAETSFALLAQFFVSWMFVFRRLMVLVIVVRDLTAFFVLFRFSVDFVRTFDDELCDSIVFDVPWMSADNHRIDRGILQFGLVVERHF
jgi:hypothetical protein